MLIVACGTQRLLLHTAVFMHTHGLGQTDHELQTAKAQQQKYSASSESNCVPWSYYDGLNRVDETDRVLRSLSAKHTRARAKG
jgi:hypothetical protein